MGRHSGQVSALFSSFILSLTAVLGACGPARPSETPVIHAELGMSLETFIERSDYDFPSQGSLSGGFMFGLNARGPFDFEFVFESNRLSFEDIGPTNIVHSFDFINEKLEVVRLYPHRNGLTLDEAIVMAEELEHWFETAGFEGVTRFPVRRARDPNQLPEVASLSDAAALLRDLDHLVGDMVLYNGEHDDVSVVVSVSNGRRLRSLTANRGDAYGDENPNAGLWLMNVWIGRRLDIDELVRGLDR